MNQVIFMNLFQVAVLLFILFGTLRLIEIDRHSLKAALFAFAITSVLLSDLYWLAYEILRPGTRMPFAANEIGEWAFFLLLGASLSTRRPISFRSARADIVFAVLFSAASAALWIAWSGEWVQDILTGASFGYFLCAVVSRAKRENAFSVFWRRLFVTVCAVLIAAQSATFFVPDPLKKPLDLFCYALLFAFAAVLLPRAILSLKKDADPALGVCNTFAAFVWIVTALYMSSEPYYYASAVLTTLGFLLMYLAVRREVRAA